MNNTLEIITNNRQEEAEWFSFLAWEGHRAGMTNSAQSFLKRAEASWEQWVDLKGLTRIIGQAQELRAMTRSEVRQ